MRFASLCKVKITKCIINGLLLLEQLLSLVVVVVVAKIDFGKGNSALHFVYLSR